MAGHCWLYKTLKHFVSFIYNLLVDLLICESCKLVCQRPNISGKHFQIVSRAPLPLIGKFCYYSHFVPPKNAIETTVDFKPWVLHHFVKTHGSCCKEISLCMRAVISVREHLLDGKNSFSYIEGFLRYHAREAKKSPIIDTIVWKHSTLFFFDKNYSRSSF